MINGMKLKELKQRLNGRLIETHDAGYDAARLVWNGMIDRRPALIAPYSDGSRYLNFAGFQEEGESMTRQGYGPHYGRLAELKRKYDPDNFFRLNPNVLPA